MESQACAEPGVRIPFGTSGNIFINSMLHDTTDATNFNIRRCHDENMFVTLGPKVAICSMSELKLREIGTDSAHYSLFALRTENKCVLQDFGCIIAKMILRSFFFIVISIRSYL